MIQENYFQPTGFRLVLNRKHYKNTEYTLTSVNHPDVTLPGIEMPYRSINTHMSGDRLAFGEVTFEMIIDEDLKNYNEMYQILLDTVQEANQQRNTRDPDVKPLDMDITLVTLSSKNNKNKEIVYYDARLTSIGAMPLQSATAAVQYLTVPLGFEFSYFEIK